MPGRRERALLGGLDLAAEAGRHLGEVVDVGARCPARSISASTLTSGSSTSRSSLVGAALGQVGVERVGELRGRQRAHGRAPPPPRSRPPMSSVSWPAGRRRRRAARAWCTAAPGRPGRTSAGRAAPGRRPAPCRWSGRAAASRWRPARASGPWRRAAPSAPVPSASQPASACSSLAASGSMNARRVEPGRAVGRSAAPRSGQRRLVTSPVPRPQVPSHGQPDPAAAGLACPASQPATCAGAEHGRGRRRSPPRLAGGGAAELPDDPVRQRGVQPVAQHPELQRVEQLVDLVPVPRHRDQVARGRPRAGRPGSARSAGGCAARLPRCSRSLSPALPLTSSTRSTSAASEPNSATHLAAVFSPTPGMPGRLSLGSPRSAAKSGYWAGVSPYFSGHRGRGEPGHVADAAPGHQHGHVVADQLERVPVAGDDQHVHAVARRPGWPAWRSRRRPRSRARDSRGMPSASSTSKIRLSWPLKSAGVSVPVRLVLDVLLVPERRLAAVEGDRDVGRAARPAAR